MVPVDTTVEPKEIESYKSGIFPCGRAFIQRNQRSVTLGAECPSAPRSAPRRPAELFAGKPGRFPPSQA